jgi:hypothetical protein
VQVRTNDLVDRRLQSPGGSQSLNRVGLPDEFSTVGPASIGETRTTNHGQRLRSI